MIRMEKISTTRGAAMGRATYDNFDGNAELPNVRWRLNQVAMSSDSAYDTGGAYWGIGKPLWCAERQYFDEDTCKEYESREFIRASSRDEAKSILRKYHKHAEFYR